jgi:hypothetical protein
VLKAIIGELDNLFLFLGSLSVLLLSLLGVYVCIQGCFFFFFSLLHSNLPDLERDYFPFILKLFCTK